MGIKGINNLKGWINEVGDGDVGSSGDKDALGLESDESKEDAEPVPPSVQ